jgi:polyhydroxyalkanoate synthase
MRTKSFDVDAILKAFGNVPWPLMQASFHMLKPTLNLQKAMHVLDRAWDDESLEGFLALEGWGADNVSFPGECYRTYIRALYQNDDLIRGDFTVTGTRVSLANIRCPLLVLTFEQDHIVPWQSAAALLDLVRSTDKSRIHLPGGHVGAVVSSSARTRLWPLLSEWGSSRDGAEPVLVPRTAN